MRHRKIPARKHMGIRDPIKQREEREKLLKDKINHPPEKADYQKVSHSLARFIKLKEDAAAAARKGKVKKVKKIRVENEDKPENYKKKNKKDEHRNDKELKPIIQKQNESDEAYLRRVKRITVETAQEAKFEAKYGVEVVRNPKTGEIKVKKKPVNEIDERLKENAKRERESKNGKKVSAVPNIVLTSDERRKMAKELMAHKKTDDKGDEKKIEEYKKDEFVFGEVVHAPPTLATPRHGKKAETVPRPGQKSLLLHSVIERNSDVVKKPETSQPPIKKSVKVTKSIGTLKGKRKDLSMSLRHMIDTEQSNVVEMYRQLKKTKREEANAK